MTQSRLREIGQLVRIPAIILRGRRRVGDGWPATHQGAIK